MYHIFETEQEATFHTADLLKAEIKSNPASVLGLATGGTMEPVYARLTHLLNHENTDLSKITTYNLDEYVGLSRTHNQSYYYYMQQHLFKHLRSSFKAVNLPNGCAKDLLLECKRYSESIQSTGGLDFQLLGIGSNGHIGFNEPHTPFDSTTHIVELSEQTRIDNGRFFDDQQTVPTHAITMGIQDIMQAKKIVLLATGQHKAQTMYDLVNSKICESMPASILKNHTHFNLIMDKAAASLITAEKS